MDTKARLDKLITQIGIIAVLEVDNEKELRVVIENADSLNTIQIKGRLRGQNSTSLLQEISGNGNEKVNISTYEQVIIECTQLNPDPVGIGVVRIIASSFNLASGSAIEIDAPAGDNLNDVEVLTFTSSDNSVVITGDNTTKSIDFSINLNLDDVREYPTLLDFPPVGQLNTLYVALDTEKIYRWSGSTYIEVSPSPVTSVNSQTGDVVLDKSSIGLGNVDNTSDLDKPISTATQTALNLKQDSLGFTPENIANKSDNSALGTSSSLYPTQKAVKEYVDAAVTAGAPDADATTKGILKLTGDLGGTADSPTVPGLATKYDASNPAGYITLAQVPASAVTSVNSQTGDVVLSKSDIGLGNVDNTSDLNKPISTATATALSGKQDSLGFTPENVSNKSTDTALGTSDSLYPSQKAVKTYVDNAVTAGAPDANSTTKGILKLTGDLGGTADSPTVPALANKVEKSGDTMTGSLNMSALSENVQFSVYGLNATQGIEIRSDDDATRSTGNVKLSTGDASNADSAGSIYLEGGSNVDGNPANIVITAGQSSGTGSDGVIILDSKGVVYLNQNPSGYVDAVNHQIINVSDPISPQDAATKNWVEGVSSQTNVLYVDSTASLFGADGSLFRPFVTIADALAAASNGYVIEILPGTYNETQVIIPSTLYSLTIKGQSQNSVIVTNGFSYTSPASSIDLLLEELNVGQLSLDASAALNGTVTLKQTSVSLNRTDSNANVFLTISETTIFGGTCYGAANASECLIIGNIDIYSFLFIFENCKFVSSVTAYGTALIRVLDSNLFGATEFLNGVTVGVDVPILQIDTASDYFGSFTGTATKILLANIPVDKLTQSGATTNQAIVWDGTKWNPAFLVSNDPVDNNSPDIAPSQQAVLTKLNEYLRLQDGGTITGPVEIQNNKANYAIPNLRLTSEGGSSNIFTISRNRSLGDSDSSSFTGVDLNYNSAEASNNGTIYFINANSNLPQVNDLVLFESTNNIQNVEGYICTTEVYYYISNVTSGIWDFYNRYSITNHTGTLNGYDFQANITTMTSGNISGVNFTANIADKGAGNVAIFETNSNINFTSTGDDFNGVKITPTIAGTPDNVTGVLVDMSNSTGNVVKAIKTIGDSEFNGNLDFNFSAGGVTSTIAVSNDNISMVLQDPSGPTDFLTEVNAGGVTLQDNTSGANTGINPGSIFLYDDLAATAHIPVADGEVTTKKYVDDQDALKANLVHNHDLSAINGSGASSGQVPTWNGTSWVPQTPSGGGSSISILDEGSQITASAASINFTGGGVTASSDLSGNVTISVSTAGDATTLIVEAYNDTGATIPKMSVVYINGAHGNLPKLSLSLGNAEPTSSKTLGIVRSDISNMNNGFVVATGKLIDLDTNIVGWNEGDSLWLSPSVAGGITNVKPLAPNHAVFVGTLIRKHPTQGIIEVKIQNGFELQELHNVSINGISDGQIIRYENATSLWKNVTLNSDGVAEGSTNLYFTDARARTAAVADSIVDGVANIAPSQNAVFDGLSAKQATLVSGTNIKTINGSSILGSGDLVISGSGAVNSVNGQVGDVVLDKSDVGLGNVDNTSDSTKPVSTATQTALDTKENTINKSSDAALGTSNILYPTQNAVKSYVDTGLSGKQNSLGFTPENIINKSTNTSLGTSDTAYPTQNAVKVYVDNAIAGAAGAVTSVNSQIGNVVLTKADIGLSNVDNTSDANKPVSTATQTALNLKADSSALSGKVSTTGDSMTGALSISVASDTALTANTLKLGNLFGGFASVTTSSTSSDSLLLASAFPAANNASSAVYILSGYTDNANTGALLISSGNVGSGEGSSGNIQIGTGTPSGNGSSGNMDFYSANCSGTGSTGYAALRSGTKNGTTGNSGPAVVDSGANNGSGDSGFVRLKSGNTVSGNSGSADVATGNVSGAGNSGNIILTTGTVTSGVRGEIRIAAPNLNLQNNSITNTAAFYFGNPNTDGTWRIIPSGSNLVTERRESGVWVTKQTITP